MRSKEQASKQNNVEDRDHTRVTDAMPARDRTKIPEWAAALITETDRREDEVKRLLPTLVEARRRYFASKRTDADRLQLDAVEAEVSAAHERFSDAVKALEDASGIRPEILDQLSSKPEAKQGPDRVPRANLRQELIASTADIDDLLPNALEVVRRLLPSAWADAEPRQPSRLDALTCPGSFLSLTKGLRPESESPLTHRFRQHLQVSQDYRDGYLAYDHFAGATVVPSLVQLGLQLDGGLQHVGGDVNERLERLWRGASIDVDATLLELFTASGCARSGRNVEFITATSAKSPDLRCHDPFPMVIECKRQRALSDYEIAEEAVMRDIFSRLQDEAERRGLYGRFSLRLNVEASCLDRNDVVATLIRQRLAPHPERELIYPWGRTAFNPLPRRLQLSETTRLYSPLLLEEAFGWCADLPDWDGLCCSIANAHAMVMDEALMPLGLIWDNLSQAAMRKRTWAPTNLFGGAMSQIPPGEFGIIYIAYVEGAREEIADLRVKAFMERIKDFEHAGSIRVPIAFLSRLYPRPLRDGQPDLIESSMKLYSAEYGEPVLFDDFPAAVFTMLP